MPTDPSDRSTSRHFTGINAWHQPGDLAIGELTQADNVLVLGSDLVSRPGRQGVLLAAQRHASPVYVLGAFRKADGSTGCVYTSGGKVYQLAKSAAGAFAGTPSEILMGGASLAINSATATGCRLGKYFYFADGTANGPLYRTDLTGVVATPFQAAPTTAPSASLTNTLIDALTGGGWTADTLSGAGLANRLPNWDFSASTSAPNPVNPSAILPTGYTGFGYSPDENGTPAGAHYVNQDTPGDGIYNTTPLANDPVAADASRYARQFFVACQVIQYDATGKSSLIIEVDGYSDAAGNNLIARDSVEVAPPFNGQQPVRVEAVLSLASAAVESPYWRVRFTAGQANRLGSNTALYFSDVVAFPFAAALTAQVTAGQVEVSQPLMLAYTQYSGGPVQTSAGGTLGGGVGVGGQHLTRDFGAGSPQNWAGYSNVILGLGKAAGVTGLTLRLAFRQDGSPTRYYTNPFTIAADSGSATCDISTVPATVRGAFRYAELVLGGDVVTPPSSGADVLLFGPLTGAGNLSIGYSDYSWVQTEVNASTDMANLVDVIESNPSPASGALTPTVQQAEAAVALGTSATNAGTTHRALYRYGGVFTDVPAVGRLIGVVPVGADVAMGADARNPYYSWKHATGTLTDNTPDSFLIEPGSFPNAATALVQGRDVPPLGVSALCAYHGRLIAAVGSTLSVSWLVTPTNPSALYFTLAQIPNDPNQAIKGATFPVGGAFDNDPVQALVGTNTAVVIEKQTSKGLLQGYDGFTFNVQDYLKGTGVGCVAPRAACLLQNQEAALGSSGVFGYDIARVTPLSQAIEPLLRPKGWDGTAGIPAAVFSGSCMAEWDRRLLLSTPALSTDTQNTVTWVYDTRQAGWTRWTFGVTSVVSLSSATDAGECLLGGYDGMLYVLRGNADTASSDGAAAAITVTVNSRGFGQESDDLFWVLDKALWLSALVTVPASTAVTQSVTSDSGQVRVLPAYTISGRQMLRQHADDVRGLYLTVGMSASVTGPLRLTALRGEIAEGARRSA